MFEKSQHQLICILPSWVSIQLLKTSLVHSSLDALISSIRESLMLETTIMVVLGLMGLLLSGDPKRVSMMKQHSRAQLKTQILHLIGSVLMELSHLNVITIESKTQDSTISISTTLQPLEHAPTASRDQQQTLMEGQSNSQMSQLMKQL